MSFLKNRVDQGAAGRDLAVFRPLGRPARLQTRPRPRTPPPGFGAQHVDVIGEFVDRRNEAGVADQRRPRLLPVAFAFGELLFDFLVEPFILELRRPELGAVVDG
jgi:hypothetical protein